MKEIVINVDPLETRIARLEDKRLAELIVERKESKSLVGNIYKGRIDSVIPGIQAAFVDIGKEKNGFLYVADIAGVEGTGDFEFEDGAAKPRKRGQRQRQQRIEDIVKKGQHIMVQVAKDTLGTKGVRLTNYISMPGRYIVLMPTVAQLGVSRKIESDKERDRLKRILQTIRTRDIGLITRTEGEGRSKAELRDDFKYLKKVWEEIKRRMENKKGATLLHEDLGPILRVVRDTFTNDVTKLIIDSSSEYERIQLFLEQFAPGLQKRCKLHVARRPLFEKMGIDEEISKALKRKVKLKSGGNICIDQAEALVAIDVNTGKFTGKKHLEDTVLKTNLEAAEEIARQVRLRDMGGIIICDFIDMKYETNRRELLKKFKECLKSDRARTTVSGVSELGLVEMTRKRVKHNLVSALSQYCPYCEGTGMVRSVTTMTFDVIRRVRGLFCRTKEKRVVLQLHPDVARRLRTENKELIDDVATTFEREIAIESVSDFHVHDVKVLSARTRKEIKGAR